MTKMKFDKYINKKLKIKCSNKNEFQGWVDNVTSALDDPCEHDSITLETKDGLINILDSEIVSIKVLEN